MFEGEVFIVSPHMDDEVLGCGGLLGKLRAENKAKNVTIHYCNYHHPLYADKEYMEENERLVSYIGCGKIFSPFHLMQVNKLPEVSITEFISLFELMFANFKPQTLLIPFPSYNQDHRHLFEACVTASRPHDRNHYIKNVLVYEQPETIQTNRIEPRFSPHLFVPIDIEEKIKLYSFYQTQQRGHRSATGLKHLAGFRGLQCGSNYAESFMILRATV
jgi:LmbE family N-acetylglucosaminyl deacetylase